jgi:hypothetical protein
MAVVFAILFLLPYAKSLEEVLALGCPLLLNYIQLQKLPFLSLWAPFLSALIALFSHRLATLI